MVVLGIGAVLGAVLLVSILTRGDDSAWEIELPEATAPAVEPSAKERKLTEEQDRRQRAKEGQVGVFNATKAGDEILGETGAIITYSVAAEEATGVRPRDFASDVDAALGDPRSWTAQGDVRFERAEDGRAAVRIVLGTPATVDELCLPLDTIGELSCRQGSQLNVNLKRWLNGTDSWPLTTSAYRNHVINHEMGHFLGYDHLYCSSPGALAPVMMQQTKGLSGCKANEWPYPDAKTGR